MFAEAKGSVNGEDVDFEGGFVLLPDKAFVEYKDTQYEVDPTTFSFVESAIKQAKGESGAQGGVQGTTECQEAASALKPADFVDNLKNEGGSDVDGTETTKVSGDLNVGGSIDTLLELVENPACSAQVETAGGVPVDEIQQNRGAIEGAVKNAHADVYVGEDNIVRRVSAEITLQPEGADEKVDLEFDLALNGVNEEQDITAPEGAEPLEGLFKELDVNPLDLLQALQGGDIGALLEELGGGEVEIPGVGGGGGRRLFGLPQLPEKVEHSGRPRKLREAQIAIAA